MIPILALSACHTPEPAAVAPPPADDAPLTLGTQALQRLNRSDYDNTVAELFHTRLRPASALFPPDLPSHGFDNQAAALTLTPYQVELYERAADLLVDDLFRVRAEHTALTDLPFRGPGLIPVNGELRPEGYTFFTDGSLSAVIDVPDDGRYAFRATASGLSPDVPVELVLELDGQPLAAPSAATGTPGTFAAEVWLQPGARTFGVRFVNPNEERTRALQVVGLQLEGPLDPEIGDRADYWRVVPCDPAAIGETACAQHALLPFARQAWRRPLTPADEGWILDTYHEARSAGLAWRDSMAIAMKVVILAPDFLFRIEADAPTGKVRRLSDHEIAARLSYFLWSSPPDEALRVAADRGELVDPAVLGWHARRMLADPRAEALVDEFAEQWFGVRALSAIQPDPVLFPTFDEALREGMGDELRHLARVHLLEDRSMLELITTQETAVDARLAAHYGLDVAGEADLATLGRRGLLTTAGLLALTSHPDRTSVVRRGKFVLGALLCDEPPPPPPGIGELDDVDPQQFDSVREQIEAHRADPACAACHAEMDPIGFALEPFDALGRLRTIDELGAPIDSIAPLADGTTLRGPFGVAEWIATDPRLPACMAEKVFTWGLGRIPQTADAPHLEAMTERFVAEDHRFASLVLGLVESPAFRMKVSPEESP